MMSDVFNDNFIYNMSPGLEGIGKLHALHHRLDGLGCRGQDWALLIFAGDNGISQEGTSHYPALCSAQIVAAHLDGTSPTARLLGRLGKKEWIFDLGLCDDIDAPALIRKRIRRGARNFINEDALDYGEVLAALEAGRAVWEIIKDYDYDMIGLGEIGIGNTLCASALGMAAMGIPVNSMIGPGSAGFQVMERKLGLIRRAMEQRMPDPHDVPDLLVRFGGLEIAALTGFINESAKYSLPLILDGFVTSVAALLATMLNSQGLPNLFCPSLSQEPGHRPVLERLQIEPWFDLDINYGEGLASALGLFLAEVTMSFYQ